MSSCPFYSVSFDESINRVSQKDKWTWSCVTGTANQTKSVFLGHPCASDFLNAFMSAITGLGLRCERIIQISMDGPNVKLAFLKDFENTLNAAHYGSNNLIDIGSCSLHIFHGAYKYAHNKTTWKLNSILRSAYYLFKDSVSTCGLYTFFGIV